MMHHEDAEEEELVSPPPPVRRSLLFGTLTSCFDGANCKCFNCVVCKTSAEEGFVVGGCAICKRICHSGCSNACGDDKSKHCCTLCAAAAIAK